MQLTSPMTMSRNTCLRRPNLTTGIGFNCTMSTKVKICSSHQFLYIFTTRSILSFFQIHPREIMWHQPTLRYLTIIDNHIQQLNMSIVVVRISCFKGLLGCDQTVSRVRFSGCWQKGNTNVKVVAKLQTEVMNALNSTFTEADWPKGTKKGNESFSPKFD